MKNGHSSRTPKPKRFYAQVSVKTGEHGWGVLLDSRPVKTPGRLMLNLPNRLLAEAVAKEWRDQAVEIDFAAMPLTRLANTAIDGVSANAKAVAEDILTFAGRDLLCYRAEQPADLIERQKRMWDPLIIWAMTHCGARMTVTNGVMPVDQSGGALDAVRDVFARFDPFALTALHVMTSLTGSAILALAHAEGYLALEDCWAAAHVDEDYQSERWGEDSEARARREARFAQMLVASEFFRLSRPAEP